MDFFDLTWFGPVLFWHSTEVLEHPEIDAAREVELPVLDVGDAAQVSRAGEDLERIAQADLRSGHDRQLDAKAEVRRGFPLRIRFHIGLQLEGLDQVETVPVTPKAAEQVDAQVELLARQILAEAQAPVARLQAG